MAMPDYQSVMLPLLRYAADEQEHSVREAIEALADQFRLNDEERKERAEPKIEVMPVRASDPKQTA